MFDQTFTQFEIVRSEGVILLAFRNKDSNTVSNKVIPKMLVR